jgi:hypothetical protein
MVTDLQAAEADFSLDLTKAKHSISSMSVAENETMIIQINPISLNMKK